MIAAALLRHLDSAEIIDFDPDGITGNAFVDTMPAEPDTAVMCKVTGGNPIDGRTVQPWEEPVVQFVVRGDRDPRTSDGLAQAIYDEVREISQLVIDEGGPDELHVDWTTPRQTAPAHIGTDGNGRHERSINFDVHITRFTTARPAIA